MSKGAFSIIFLIIVVIIATFFPVNKSNDDVTNKETLIVQEELENKNEPVNKEEQVSYIENKDEFDYYGDVIDETTRMNQEGAVMVTANFLNLKEHIEDFWVFEVSLDTHTVDLGQYNYSELITIRVDDAYKTNDEFNLSVEGALHHMSLIIKLPKVMNNKDIITPENKEIVLAINEVDGVKTRELKWNLKNI
ncbi:hypothetical protein EDC18_103270 [Natranaerovirga pectinivora]|uniref:Uncharacterized protein n=1 Tax=Natranaerovirga pectinivora TaxID=682400 RepID=A0A4R3MNE7_9FIRM|nr:hypothetical protein [Natranaerovirga pectinivora]TCT15564.1 hypothetical protein EDC18_103270 [Natranaerovirga pectinivora]